MVIGCNLIQKFLLFWLRFLLYDQQNILHVKAPKQKITKYIQQEEQPFVIFKKTSYL